MALKKKRAMSSEHASEVKVSGHKNEEHFATIINGRIHQGSHTDKRDVLDRQDRSHSVKAGKWWQIFLYSEDRLKNNTILQGIGNIAPIMVDCLNAYPKKYNDYLANRITAKIELQPHMQRLLTELNKSKIFKAFLDKALFDSSAEYLSYYLGNAKDPIDSKHFKIFHRDDVTSAIQNKVILKNSKARNINQMDDQKVIFYSLLHNQNVGEIEDRHDSELHYKQMKFRLNANLIDNILVDEITEHSQPFAQISTFGKATRLFK